MSKRNGNMNNNVEKQEQEQQLPAQEPAPVEGQDLDKQEAEPEKGKEAPKKERKGVKIFGYRLVKDEPQTKPEKPPKTKWGAGKTAGVITAIIASTTAVVKIAGVVVDAVASGKGSESIPYEEKAIEGQFKETYEFPEPAASCPSEET